MASGTPRTRVDQFYASKKRKALSPGLKSGRNEKDARTGLEKSPSARGTLDNYLVTSQDNSNFDSPSATTRDLLAREDPVKRSLSLDITSSLRDEPQEVSPLSRVHSQTSKPIEAEGLSEASNVSNERTANDCPVAKFVEQPELKQLADDFFAMYRSIGAQTIVGKPSEPKVDKRQCSQSLLEGKGKASKKGHFITSQLNLDGETHLSNEASGENLQSDRAVRTGASISSSFGEVTSSHGPVVVKASLKRCNNTAQVTANVTECQTPGSLTVKTCVRHTPKSTGGRSMFSPGEAFWSEAIEIADGLSAPDAIVSAQVAGQTNTMESLWNIESSIALRNEPSDDKLKEMRDEGECNAHIRESSTILVSFGKDLKDLSKEVSPLPVKHFDFLGEDKNLDESTPYYCSANESKNVVHRGGERFECGSVNYNDIQKKNAKNIINKYQINEKVNQVQEITPVPAATKRKWDLSGQPDDGVISASLLTKFRDSIGNGENNEADTPSSFVQVKDQLDLNSWLPSEICSIYRRKGITRLYPWQVDCLQVDGVLQRRNLVYCASTSAGKSFVAEILMLRRVISTGKMALLVLPYVSICAEKAEHLEVLLEPLEKHVRSYFGNQGGGTLPKDTSVAVCTIEKANSLINRLLEDGRLSEVGIIVIDELHMVGDQSRGYLLELMLTKLRYAAGEGNSESSSGESSGTSSGKADPAQGLQIVGMSATMPNVVSVAEWLQAALYQTEFRPVPLEEYIKVGDTIYNKEMDACRTIPKAANLSGRDPDHIVELCNEVVQDGHSVLIFCSSRKGCESTAKHISKFLKKFSVNENNADSEFFDISAAIDALRKCPAGLDPTLEETLPAGVAYHHAGLTVEEREIVETCYRKGLIRVLTATSTLAAGVNLPARRVIFRQPRIGRDFIDGIRYRQMAGRAGRTGIDTKGESILICKPEEVKRIKGILNESCPPLNSCLSEDKNGMTHAILEVVAGGIVQTASDINRYVRCTLLNATKPFQDVVKSAQESLRWLCHRKFLEWNEDTKLYSTTPLGRAAFGSSLNPEESLIVLDDLSRAREGFVLASDLHLVYLVTPVNVDVEPDWDLYYERFMQLATLDQSVGNRVGVAEPFLMHMAHGAPMSTSINSRNKVKRLHGKHGNLHVIAGNSMLSEEQTVRVCKRFYVALILSKLVQESPIAEVCESFKVARGMVQALQENAGRFASMVSVFCERLAWHDLEGLVAKFQNRVSFGVRAEIVELTMIPYVKGSRARALYKAGLRSPQAIAEASILEIVKALFESSSWTTQESSSQRRMQMAVAKKIKNGARKIVLDKAEEARIAAFSAFKSLGLSVPQISQPMLLNMAGNPNRQGTDTTPSRIETTSGFAGAKHRDNVSMEQHAEGIHGSDKEVLKIEGAKMTEESDTKSPASAESNSISHKQCRFGAEKPQLTVEASVQNKFNPPLFDHAKNEHSVMSGLLTKHGDEINLSKSCLRTGLQEQRSSKTLCLANSSNACRKGPMNATSSPGGFDSFLDLWNIAQEFYFDIHYNKRSELNAVAPFEIRGMAICWENSPVYYINLPKDLLWSESERKTHLAVDSPDDITNSSPVENWFEIVKQRWKRIDEIMRKENVRKFTWNMKVQFQVLRNPAVCVQRLGVKKNMGLELVDGSYLVLPPILVTHGIDTCVVAWILWPDDERTSNPNLEKEVKKRLSMEAAAAANRSGQWKNQMRRAAHNGCCRRVAQTRTLCSVLWKLIISEELMDVLMNVEIPLVNILADMELWGIGVDMEGCLQARNSLRKKLRCLEKEAYELAGMHFSLYATTDIAHVLYGHLKLPIPEGHNKGKQHPSTDKHCLDLLRNEHPIVPVIKEHRTLAKLFNCTLGSICSLSRLSARVQKYTLHGYWFQTSTATGRLSMEEPNLQTVEHMVDFKMKSDNNGGDVDDHYEINARDFFVPTQDNWLFITADYSQIELRMMAHFSRDPSLMELLSKPHGDVFTMISAKWTGRSEESVSSHERDQTKRMIYGILYGMGSRKLAEQLECSADEAAEKIQSFMNSFPGVASWLQEVVVFCSQKGYVQTLKGRKRFLSKIKFGNSKEKSKAQRQAVNSICQGSAADIIKMAMINIYSLIVGVDVPAPDYISSHLTNFNMLKGRCRIVLQIHDELVLEVDPSVVKEAGLVLQMSMENAASLLVPLQVKLKVGRTWGSLEPFPIKSTRE